MSKIRIACCIIPMILIFGRFLYTRRIYIYMFCSIYIFPFPNRRRIIFPRTPFTVDHLGAARSNGILTIKSLFFDRCRNEKYTTVGNAWPVMQCKGQDPRECTVVVKCTSSLLGETVFPRCSLQKPCRKHNVMTLVPVFVSNHSANKTTNAVRRCLKTSG